LHILFRRKEGLNEQPEENGSGWNKMRISRQRNFETRMEDSNSTKKEKLDRKMRIQPDRFGKEGWKCRRQERNEVKTALKEPAVPWNGKAKKVILCEMWQATIKKRKCLEWFYESQNVGKTTRKNEGRKSFRTRFSRDMTKQ